MSLLFKRKQFDEGLKYLGEEGASRVLLQVGAVDVLGEERAATCLGPDWASFALGKEWALVGCTGKDRALVSGLEHGTS